LVVPKRDGREWQARGYQAATTCTLPETIAGTPATTLEEVRPTARAIRVHLSDDPCSYECRLNPSLAADLTRGT